jgi:hypothetical protein
MSKGIYCTEVKVLKNGELVESEFFNGIVTSKTHYGEIPEEFDTELIPAMKLFGLDINRDDVEALYDYIQWEKDLEQKLRMNISNKIKFGLLSKKPKYYATFGSWSGNTIRFKPYDVFQFKKKVRVIDWWTLDMVVSRLSIDECKEFLIDKGFISKNPSSEEFTRICGYTGR